MVEITKDKLEEHINVFMNKLTAGSSATFFGFDTPSKTFLFRKDGVYKIVFVFDSLYGDDNSIFSMIIEKIVIDKEVEYKYYQISSVYEYKQLQKENNWDAFALGKYDYKKMNKLPISWIWEKYDKKTLEKDLKIEIYPDLLNNLNIPVLLDTGLKIITGCRPCPYGRYHEWLDGLHCTKIKDGYYGKQIPSQSVDYEHERPRWCPLTRAIEDGKEEYLELGKKLGYVKDE